MSKLSFFGIATHETSNVKIKILHFSFEVSSSSRMLPKLFMEKLKLVDIGNFDFKNSDVIIDKTWNYWPIGSNEKTFSLSVQL